MAKKTTVKDNTNTSATPKTPKVSKQGCIDFLTEFTDLANNSEVLNPEKSLLDRIAYSLKNAAKATAKDLMSLVTEARAVLNDSTPAPVEASAKPKKLSSKKKKAEKPAEKAPEKTAKKPKKMAVDTVPPVSTAGVDKHPIASMFPEKIEHADLGTLIAADGQFTTFDDVMKAIDEGKTLYFAAYWTPRQLKEFNYAGSYNVKAPKAGFPDDLDLMQAAVPCTDIKRLWCLSVYTEAMYRFDEDTLDYVTETDPRGDGKSKFRVRVNAGMEYEIYVPEEEFVKSEK